MTRDTNEIEINNPLDGTSEASEVTPRDRFMVPLAEGEEMPEIPDDLSSDEDESENGLTLSPTSLSPITVQSENTSPAAPPQAVDPTEIQTLMNNPILASIMQEAMNIYSLNPAMYPAFQPTVQAITEIIANHPLLSQQAQNLIHDLIHLSADTETSVATTSGFTSLSVSVLVLGMMQLSTSTDVEEDLIGISQPTSAAFLQELYGVEEEELSFYSNGAASNTSFEAAGLSNFPHGTGFDFGITGISI